MAPSIEPRKDSRPRVSAAPISVSRARRKSSRNWSAEVAKPRFEDDPDQWSAYASHIARRKVGSREEIEDAIQAGILRMMPALARVDRSQPAEKCRGYLRQFIVRGIEEHFDRFRETPDVAVIERSDDWSQVEAVEISDERKRLIRAIQHLPNFERQVIARSYLRSMSRPEIARDLGRDLRSVEGALVRGETQIKIVLAGGRSDRRRTKIRRPKPTMVFRVETRGRKRAMARQRTVRPDDFTAPPMKFTAVWHLFWIGLRTQADFKGLFRWDEAALKKAIVPDHEADVAAILHALEMNNLVHRYVVDGVAYGWIRGFEDRNQSAEVARGPRWPQPTVRGYVKWEPPGK